MFLKDTGTNGRLLSILFTSVSAEIKVSSTNVRCMVNDSVVLQTDPIPRSHASPGLLALGVNMLLNPESRSFAFIMSYRRTWFQPKGPQIAPEKFDQLSERAVEGTLRLLPNRYRICKNVSALTESKSFTYAAWDYLQAPKHLWLIYVYLVHLAHVRPKYSIPVSLNGHQPGVTVRLGNRAISCLSPQTCAYDIAYNLPLPALLLFFGLRHKNPLGMVLSVWIFPLIIPLQPHVAQADERRSVQPEGRADISCRISDGI